MKKIIDAWMYGVGIGMFWYVLNLLIWKVPGQGTGQIMVTLICSGLMGLATLIFELRGKSDLFKTLLHFVVIFILTSTMIVVNGWISELTWSLLLSLFVEILVIYLITWVIFYQIEKQKIKKINEKLRKK